jgi:FMN phosphatase YigB (HAD superfamily)
LIRLVLFDLWGTLLAGDAGDPPSVAREAVRVRRAGEALATRGLTYDEQRIRAAFAAADAEHGRIHADGRDITAEARTILYLRHLDESIADRLDDDGWRALHNAILTPALESPPHAVDGAREALMAVKALGLPTGLVSNAGITPGFVLRQVLAGHGLLEHLDETVFSDEVELAKPSAAIFERALDAFGVAPSEAAFVGDQPVLDVLGPMAAGLWSIQVGDLREDGIVPHVRIPSVADVIEGLRELNEITALEPA